MSGPIPASDQAVKAVGRVIGVVGLLAAATVWSSTGEAGAVAAGDVFVTGAVYAPSTLSSCPGSAGAAAPLRALVDGLDDGWRASSSGAGLTQFSMLDLGSVVSDPVVSHPTVVPFVGLPVSASVSLRNVPQASVAGFGGAAGDPSKGALAVVNANGPSVGVGSSRTLQDCAPYPASLYGVSAGAQTPGWFENAGDGTALNGVLFEFSTPVRAFGAWFGDVESRAGSPAWVKLFDAAGVVVWEGPVGAEVATDAECGGTNEVDGLRCGNQGTRWVGFVAPVGERVSSMLLTVGDDDSCVQVGASQCGGGSEHLSFVGATVAVDALGDPDPTTTTSSSTSTSSTSSTTTSTTDPGATTSTTDPGATTSTTDPGATTTTTTDPGATTSTTDPGATTTTTTDPGATTTTTTDPGATTTTTTDPGTTTTTDPGTTTTTDATASTTSSTSTTDPGTTTTTTTDATTSTSAGATTTTAAAGGGGTQPTTTLPPGPGAHPWHPLPTAGGNTLTWLRFAGLFTAAGLMLRSGASRTRRQELP